MKSQNQSPQNIYQLLSQKVSKNFSQIHLNVLHSNHSNTKNGKILKKKLSEIKKNNLSDLIKKLNLSKFKQSPININKVHSPSPALKISQQKLNTIKSQVNSILASSIPKKCNKSASIDFESQPLQLPEDELILSYAYRSIGGRNTEKPKKVNQDAYLTYPYFGNHQNSHLFAVFDGHGINGHIVSNFLKQILPCSLLKNPNYKINKELALRESFNKAQNSLIESEIDINLSGFTATCILIKNNELITANLGDSRSILIKTTKNNPWKAIPLTRDHKPNLKSELSRIIYYGGKVEPIRDYQGNFVGPYRVWCKENNLPGLAMARSFGDLIAASVGVTHHPEIFSFQLNPLEDKVIILASDGIWQYISNQECANIIQPYYEKNDLDGACQALMDKAEKVWTIGDDTIIDDITFIVVFLSFC